jgi:pyruvate dehydrogenase E2 component (dihydrolipoamide acetyltransferase)
MPQLGISEESAVLTQWHVKEGEPVQTGQKLFTMETSKSSFDVEAEVAGTVLRLLAAEGDEIAVKAPVCIIGNPGEQLPADSEERAAGGISPRAKNLAVKLGADPAQAVPTGPGGRVIERDIRAAAGEAVGSHPPPQEEPPPRETGYTDRPLANIRKIIASKMTQSLQTTAQLTHTASFDASAVLAAKRPGVTLTAVILHTVARVLNGFPELNAHLLGDTLRVFSEVHLAVAVDTERGLMVPVIRGASLKTPRELSEELEVLAGQCRSGGIPPDLLSGGSFTVSNLGRFGIESFTPVLNAPQTGILGVCAIGQRVREQGGAISVYPAMPLSLTYDHRALDGAPASRFLQTLCNELENYIPPPLAAE